MLENYWYNLYMYHLKHLLIPWGEAVTKGLELVQALSLPTDDEFAQSIVQVQGAGWRRTRGNPGKHGKTMEKWKNSLKKSWNTWENYGKIWENHGKRIEHIWRKVVFGGKLLKSIEIMDSRWFLSVFKQYIKQLSTKRAQRY